MTDEITPQTQPPVKKEDKNPSSGNNRGPKRQPSNSSNPRGGSANARPSSRGSNKKAATNTPNTESGSDTASRKGSDNSKRQDQRGKNQANGGRGSGRRQPSASQATRNNREQGAKSSSSPAPAQTKESSDALSSLQRVIADLKTASPVQPQAGSNTSAGMPGSQGQSSLPVHAPVFQPGAGAYPGTNIDPKHRKAASLGNSTLSGNFNSYSPHLGSMMEDAEDGASFEEGEIPEQRYHSQGHQPRSQSQSFMAPRFAALAAQQEQDPIGPTGRPQLAPGFMFGARKRVPSMGPPISEEDVGFQFPQQQQNYASEASAPVQGHRKSESGEITGIMAEQVCLFCFYSFISNWD